MVINGFELESVKYLCVVLENKLPTLTAILTNAEEILSH